jgi:hypothetical protein
MMAKKVPERYAEEFEKNEECKGVEAKPSLTVRQTLHLY